MDFMDIRKFTSGTLKPLEGVQSKADFAWQSEIIQVEKYYAE